jgi:hypothetical protein
MRAKSLMPAVIALLVWLSGMEPVQAGFGRTGSSDRSGSSARSSDGGRRSSSSNRETVRSGDSGRSPTNKARPTPRPSWTPGYYNPWGYGIGYVPPVPPPGLMPGSALAPGVAAESLTYSDRDVPEPPNYHTVLTGDLVFGGDKLVAGLGLLVEERLLGVRASLDVIALPSYENGERQYTDSVYVGQVRGTVALVALPQVRLRAEAGVHFAVAPEVSFVAPGLGTSLAINLTSLLGLDLRLNGSIWPYTQVDARASATLAINRFGLSAGVRSLYLNDDGALGEANAGDTSDHVWGPYVALAIVL